MKTETKPVVRCPECGGTDFYITETLSWKASVDVEDPHIINCWNKDSEIVHIECSNGACMADVTHLENQEGVEFNWN